MNSSRNLLTLALFSALTLSACTEGQLDRLSSIGKPPPMKPIENPVDKPDYKPVSWPQPAPQASIMEKPVNSLWQPGSRTFFRDQRARSVGDILRVNVSINDKATLDNKMNNTRNSSQSLSAGSVFGLERRIVGVLPGKADPNNLLAGEGAMANDGAGKVDRKESVTTQMAAYVTQVLPNGNLVIEGSQEVRVNFEMRKLSVTGVVRPEDIAADNSIDSNKIAEARISYGGEGVLTDVQQPRIGHQIIDTLSPF